MNRLWVIAALLRWRSVISAAPRSAFLLPPHVLEVLRGLEAVDSATLAECSFLQWMEEYDL